MSGIIRYIRRKQTKYIVPVSVGGVDFYYDHDTKNKLIGYCTERHTNPNIKDSLYKALEKKYGKPDEFQSNATIIYMNGANSSLKGSGKQATWFGKDQMLIVIYNDDVEQVIYLKFNLLEDIISKATKDFNSEKEAEKQKLLKETERF